MPTVRFASVVERAGAPAPYLSWTTPGKDRALRKLVRQVRVLTVHQELRGARRDFGTVGWHRDRTGQLLVFPKSLRRFADRKIVGIDYGLLAPANHGAGAPVKGKARPANSVAPRAPVKTGSGPRPARAPVRPRTQRPGTSRRAAESRSLRATVPSRDVLLRAVRKAIAELQAGRTVAAWERLQAVAGR